MPAPKHTKVKTVDNSQPTVIDVNLDYTIPALCKALGVDERVIRDARSRGLKTKLFGDRRLVIRGEDLDLWLKTQAEDAPAPKGKSK